MIYLDSSALVKLVHEEPETAQLRQYLARSVRVPKVTSALACTELPRAIRRLNHDNQRSQDGGELAAELDRARELLQTLRMVEVTRALLADAASVGDPLLRTLDAIHLVAALRVATGMTAFLTYDKRLGAQARGLGLPVGAPA